MITHALDPHTHSCQSRCKRVHVYETEEMYRAGRAFGHVSDIPAPAQRGRLDLRSTFTGLTVDPIRVQQHCFIQTACYVA